MMSSSGNWSMIARATVNPPTPESNTPMGASALLMSAQLLTGPLRPFAATLASFAFGPGQQIRREHAGDAAAEVALPGHSSADVEHRHRPPQDTAVHHQYHQPDDDLPTRTGEEPEHQQEGQPAEDQAGGADVIALQADRRSHVADQ